MCRYFLRAFLSILRHFCVAILQNSRIDRMDGYGKRLSALFEYQLCIAADEKCTYEMLEERIISDYCSFALSFFLTLIRGPQSLKPDYKVSPLYIFSE